MKTPKLDVQDVKEAELEELLAAVEGKIAPHLFELLSRLVATCLWIFQLLEKEGVTVGIFRRLFLRNGRNSEKTKDVLGEPETNQENCPDESESQDREETSKGGKDNEQEQEEEEREPSREEKQEQEAEEKKKRKGHGRNGVEAYPGAERVPLPHPELNPGDSCPACLKGTLYRQPPGKVLRIKGRSLLEAKVYEPERLRCGLCGKIYRSDLPPEAGDTIYDESAGSMLALMKYGAGMPFYRMEKLQEGFGVPLPDSTQWDIVEEVSKRIEPAYDGLLTLAAQGQVFYNDDTGMTILELEPDPDISPERTGVYTTGIVVLAGEHQIALFFTGRKHAGERLDQVLDRREDQAPIPIQMSDALSRNVPKNNATRQANCNSHGRRNFVKIADNFPEPVARVLRDIRSVYRNEAKAREQQMGPEERLEFHQQHSGPILEELRKWMERQFSEKLVEPNSGLGKAMNYMLNHWEKLTLFLREPGAPLDNNICERVLKMAILHRKNALFYKTENGARVGDLFMSLIHTCRLNRVNPFEYLTVLQRHREQVRAHPEDWMPWNYRATQERQLSSPPPPSPPA